MESAMLFCPLKQSLSRFPIIFMPKTLTPFNFGYVISHAKYTTFSTSSVKNISPCVGRFSSRMSSYSLRVAHKPSKTPRAAESCESKVKSDSVEKPNLIGKMQVGSPTLEGFDFEEDKEIKRRKKVVHGNKGRVPWNKGRKHSEETREKIRQRTKEALKDPKVRKKMSECPRTLSDQTKARIRAALTKVWGKRLQWKRSREKFLRSWAQSIAKAAKIGGDDQQELEWDSYDKIKREIALLQLHEAQENAKAKERTRVQAERAAQLRAEKKAMLAQKRQEREENAKARGESVRKRNKRSKEEKEKLAEVEEVKLKERLMKIHRRKHAVNKVSSRQPRSWEKFDVDFVKGGQLQKDISLADQIRSAKNIRAEQVLDKL